MEPLLHQFVGGEGDSHHGGDLDVVDTEAPVQALPDPMLPEHQSQSSVPSRCAATERPTMSSAVFTGKQSSV